MLLHKLLVHPLQSVITQNTPNFDVIWSPYIWVSLWVCPRALLTSTAAASLCTSWATHTHNSQFSQGGIGQGTCRRDSKPPKWTADQISPKKGHSVVSGKCIICGKKIKSRDVISGDRDCSCLGHNNFIPWQTQTTLGMLHNELKQETSQQSSTKNNIFRALTSFDNLGTIRFHFWGCLKYSKTYFLKET